MCKMYTVIRRAMLGTRKVAWSLWTGKDVFETTAKSIKDRYDVKLCVKEGLLYVW